MWSYAVLLWELATREEPFADLSPMEAGMRVGCLTTLSVSCTCDVADSDGGAAAHRLPRRLPPHGQTHQDLHERGSRQAAHLRHDHPHSGENEEITKLTEVKSPTCQVPAATQLLLSVFSLMLLIYIAGKYLQRKTSFQLPPARVPYLSVYQSRYQL